MYFNQKMNNYSTKSSECAAGMSCSNSVLHQNCGISLSLHADSAISIFIRIISFVKLLLVKAIRRKERISV